MRPSPIPTLYTERAPVGRIACLFVAFVICLTILGPVLDKVGDMRAAQAAKADAQKQAQRQTRFERAAGVICGRHGWRLLPDQSIQCQGRRVANNTPR